MRVAVLGASDKVERYSNKALRLLVEKGHEPVPVNPGLAEVEGIRCLPSLAAAGAPLDAVTVYLNPERSAPLGQAIVAAKPGFVVFNPGSENPALEAELSAAGVRTLRACTLVLLATGRFGKA